LRRGGASPGGRPLRLTPLTSPARRIAFTILQELEGPGQTLDDRLAQPDAAALDPRERAFLHELLLGSLRRPGATRPALGALPGWLAERWLERLGPETAVARARALAEEPPTFFRLNPRVPDALARAERAGLAPRPAIVPGAWEATRGRIADLARDGVLYPQDQGSQLVAHLAATPGRLLDACAAPGGKSTLLDDLLGASGRVISAEPSPRRLGILAHLVRRWGAAQVRVVGADALRPPYRGSS